MTQTTLSDSAQFLLDFLSSYGDGDIEACPRYAIDSVFQDWNVDALLEELVTAGYIRQPDPHRVSKMQQVRDLCEAGTSLRRAAKVLGLSQTTTRRLYREATEPRVALSTMPA